MARSPATTQLDTGGLMTEGSRSSGAQVTPGGTGTLATTSQMGTISLGTLIQYINQRTYSDLLNLAEILPRKSDMDKKIDIVKFAQRTRQLYVRLLALVKWAASASKVDKCCHIMNFLEKQNSLLTDTADKLFHMTRESLMSARLPHFHIPAAVQTLTTGTYDRLPLSIRQRILSPDPMTSSEKRATLTRLEQIIQHRLVTATLPHQMRTTKVENGRVVFTVDREFEAHLTVMSDNSSDAWRLLSLHILVEDRETGHGKQLVHPLQVNYLQQLVQSRLVDHPHPLQELYSVMHAFCLSLQLEVLYAQTIKLLEERLDSHVRVEEYRQGCSLSLTYWRDLSSSNSAASGGSLTSKTSLGYRLTVQIDPYGPGRPLNLVHTPALPQKECEVAERAIRTEQLSMERLLVHTIYLRTKTRLTHLKQTLDSKLGLTTDKCVVSGSPAMLQVPLLVPCLPSEQLIVTVDTHTGILTPHIPQYPNCILIQDIHAALNAVTSSPTSSPNKLTELISELRYWLMCRRTEKSLQHLAATVHDRLPLMYDPSHPLHTLPKQRVYVTFHRHPNYVLVVSVAERNGSKCEVDLKLYLLLVREASIEDDPNDPSVQTSLPRSYMRAYGLMPLDTFLCSHGPHTKLDVADVTQSSSSSSSVAGGSSNKRHMRDPPVGEPASKRVKVPAYFLPEVVQCVALCDQLCPLAHVSSQLLRQGVRSGGVQVEDGGVGLVVRVVGLPNTPGLSPAVQEALLSSLLSLSVRVQVPQFRGVKCIVAEYIFSNVPFPTVKESSSLNSVNTSLSGIHRRSVVSVHELGSSGVYASSCTDRLVAEWHCIAQLYHLVHAFAAKYTTSNEDVGVTVSSQNGPPLSEIVRVRSYNYKSISLSYGPSFAAYCIVKFSATENNFQLEFGCEGGVRGSSSTTSSGSGGSGSSSGTSGSGSSSGVWAINPHSLLKAQLLEEVVAAKEDGLVRLACLLHATYQPCLALAKLQPTLHPGVLEKRHLACPVEVFSVVAHSGSVVRVIYRNLYCIAVQMLPGGLVAVRDGAFSSFDNSRIIDEFLPIQGLKAFLSKYVDESALSRRRSQSEDDNPPTPVPLEDSPWPVPAKPSSPARHGPITPPVSSNPHTPASPHPVAGGFSASPASGGAFPLASPPSLPGMNPSPAGGLMSHPSPGAFPAASPSGSLQQQHSVASPGFLTVPSPAGCNMSGLAAMQSPAAFMQGGGCLQMSRVLPNKTYAAAIPTLLSHHAFHSLCSQPPPHQVVGEESGGPACVLEQFLGSTYLRRHLHQASKSHNETPSSEGGSVQFKTDSLMVCASLVSNPINCLTLKLQPTPDFSDRWSPDELQVLEKFFSLKVACAPYKPNAMTAFHQILRFPQKILKDCVRIMQLELLGSGQTGAKWLVQWCLTVPPIGHQLVPPGAVGVILSRNKILFFLQLTRASTSTENDSTGGGVIVPVVHDLNTNKTQMARRTEQQQASTSDLSIRVSQAINELMARPVLPLHESSVFPCVRELVMHLNIGPDGLPYPPTSQTPTQPPTLPTSNTSSSTQQIASPHGMASPHNMASPHTPVASSTGHYSPASSGHMPSPAMSQATMAPAPSMIQPGAMGQPNTMGQTGTMGPSGSLGQPGLVAPPNMGMQGPRSMQPGMQGMPGIQGMQPNMPGGQNMQGSYGSGMYR
ncbi:Mediator complex subunit Med14 [Trinorchestia longiramus]|nr:Mediator complex subunit Med14 [Trinorchestia longiramus]